MHREHVILGAGNTETRWTSNNRKTWRTVSESYKDFFLIILVLTKVPESTAPNFSCHLCARVRLCSISNITSLDWSCARSRLWGRSGATHLNVLSFYTPANPARHPVLCTTARSIAINAGSSKYTYPIVIEVEWTLCFFLSLSFWRRRRHWACILFSLFTPFEPLSVHAFSLFQHSCAQPPASNRPKMAPVALLSLTNSTIDNTVGAIFLGVVGASLWVTYDIFPLSRRWFVSSQTVWYHDAPGLLVLSHISQWFAFAQMLR